MGDVLDEFREWKARWPDRLSTHYIGCYVNHHECMIHRLAAEVERLRNGASAGRETVTDHDAAPAAKAAELARSPGQSPRGTGGTTWQPMCWCCSGPGIQSFHESKAEAEEYREHSGIADEVEVFQVGRAFTLTDAEREAVWSAIEHGEDATVSGLPPLWTSALRQLLARLGGGA